MLAAPAGPRVHVGNLQGLLPDHGRGSRREPDEIKRAYRRLARKFHPDVSKEANAEDKFKEVQEAYEVLKDPQRRAAYDQLGSNWRAGQEFRPPPDWGRDFEFSTSSSAVAAAARRLQRFLRLAVRRSAARSGTRIIQPRRRRAAAAASPRPARITSPRSRSISRTRSAAALTRSS